MGPVMPIKDRVKHAEYQRNYYHNHKQHMIEISHISNRVRRERLVGLVRKLKDIPCADCHVKYPYYVMQFDHINPENKVRDVCRMVQNTFSKGKLLSEIAKCEVVCANCHSVRTYKRSIDKSHKVHSHTASAKTPDHIQLEFMGL